LSPPTFQRRNILELQQIEPENNKEKIGDALGKPVAIETISKADF